MVQCAAVVERESLPISERKRSGLLMIIFGLVAIMTGIFGKKFHGADIWGGNGDCDGPPLPRWVGAVLFLIVGLILIAGGVATAVRPND